MAPLLVVLCNAFEDTIRTQRKVITDSPAASRKVFMLCDAIRSAGVHPTVISLGRGRARGAFQYHSTRVIRLKKSVLLYMPFVDLPILTHILSALAPAIALLAYKSRCRQKVLILYNRNPTYLLAASVARVIGFRVFLDLEDGDIDRPLGVFARAVRFAKRVCFDSLADGGAILACRALSNQTQSRHKMCYYGTTTPVTQPAPRFLQQKIRILFCGTISKDTGADVVLGAIELLAINRPDWAAQLEFIVTGNGDRMTSATELSSRYPHVGLTVLGRTEDAAYQRLLATCDVGLAMKPTNGCLANTTFPSKVVEFASSGLLVVTTDISDVRLVLGEGAEYLIEANPMSLLSCLEKIALGREAAKYKAQLSFVRINNDFNPNIVGLRLFNFFF